MPIFQNPFNPKPPSVPPLTKITAPPTTIISNYTPHPEAKALLQPTQTPTQYASALQEGKFSQDHIHFLAHGMPEQASVGWACKSSAKVADKLEPADKSALQAAQAWTKNPTPATQQAAAAAAAKTNFQGPGAWAAQGAAWAKTPGVPAKPTPPGLTGHAVSGSVMLAAAMSAPKPPAAPKPPTFQAPTAPKAPTLQAPTAPKAPTLQAPAMPKVPTFQAPKLEPPKPPTLPERTQTAKIHQPFIDQGHAIASGKEPPT